MIAKVVPARTNGDFVRLGRYITDGKTAEHSSAVERLGRYVLDSRHGGEKVAWSRISNCGTDHVPLAMLQIRNTQACNSRAANKTLHLVISFPEGERPNERQLHQIEDRMVAALGMEVHQRLSALHVNTRHAHLHVAINRVHPLHRGAWNLSNRPGLSPYIRVQPTQPPTGPPISRGCLAWAASSPISASVTQAAGWPWYGSRAASITSRRPPATPCCWRRTWRRAKR